MIEELLLRRDHLRKRVIEIQKEMNQDKDNEDTWGGHESPIYMTLEEDLRATIMMLKDIDEMIRSRKR